MFIKRYGKWDLPKGKIEKNETIEAAALREVNEECAIEELKILQPLPNTYHTYQSKGELVLKLTYWFKMSTTWNKEPKPQEEEGITEVKWFNKENLNLVRQNTYSSVADLLNSL